MNEYHYFAIVKDNAGAFNLLCECQGRSFDQVSQRQDLTFSEYDQHRVAYGRDETILAEGITSGAFYALETDDETNTSRNLMDVISDETNAVRSGTFDKDKFKVRMSKSDYLTKLFQ